MNDIRTTDLVQTARNLLNDISDLQEEAAETDGRGYILPEVEDRNLLFIQAKIDLDRCIKSLQAAGAT